MENANNLRSYTFRREREDSWRALEALLAKVDRDGIRSLSMEERYRLPALYRVALSSLSVARTISLDRNVLTYLEGLAARSYLVVYSNKQGWLEAIRDFLTRRFPGTVYRLRAVVLTTVLLLAAGTLCGYHATRHDPDLYFSFVPEWLAGERTPAASREELVAALGAQHDIDGLSQFASQLFDNNARVSMASFALGVLGGLPAALLVLTNGLTLGAFVSIHQPHGLLTEVWAWLLPHGVTELLALALCGAAGLHVGLGWILPGRHGRLHAVARRGREGAMVVLGAVGMMLIAALLEGFFRQLVVDTGARYAMAGSTAVLWLTYFGLLGRRAEGGA